MAFQNLLAAPNFSGPRAFSKTTQSSIMATYSLAAHDFLTSTDCQQFWVIDLNSLNIAATFSLEEGIFINHSGERENGNLEIASTPPEGMPANLQELTHRMERNNRFLSVQVNRAAVTVDGAGILMTDILDSDPTKMKFLSAPLLPGGIEKEGRTYSIYYLKLSYSAAQSGSPDELAMTLYYQEDPA